MTARFQLRVRIQHRPHVSTAAAEEGYRCRSWLWRGSCTTASQTLGKPEGATTIRSSWEAWRGPAHFHRCCAWEMYASAFDWSTSSRQRTRKIDTFIWEKASNIHVHTSLAPAQYGCICWENEIRKLVEHNDSDCLPIMGLHFVSGRCT